MPNPVVLAEAEFNRKVRTYWLLSGTIILVLTIVGIVLLPIWLIAGYWLTERYLRHMSCVLTDRSLKVGRGILVRQEKTVPLDKITDLALVEGPIMRFLDLQAVKIETAGSSQGAFLQIVGIKQARAFRDRVLEQRDVVVAAASGGGAAAAPAQIAGSTSGENDALLTEIRDALLRIEARLPASSQGDDA